MDVTIGTLRVEDGLNYRDETVQRSIGQRVVNSLVIEKVLGLMNDLGETELVLATRRWRDGPGKVPGPTALVQALKKAEAHRLSFIGKGMAREAAYCEIAAYCVQSCLDETGAA